MSEIIAYASSTRPNHLWSAAQFNSALPKNRLDADIPLVAKADADDLHERLLGLELLAWKWMGAHDCLKSGREYSLPRTTDKPKLVQLVETLTRALEAAHACLEDEPEYHYSGMGCGLEDRNIHDRYDAMQHGWDCAMERVYGEPINGAREVITAALAAAKEISA